MATQEPAGKKNPAARQRGYVCYCPKVSLSFCGHRGLFSTHGNVEQNPATAKLIVTMLD